LNFQDASKSLIDDASVSDEKLVDIDFSVTSQSLVEFNAKEKRELPEVIFLRISEIYELNGYQMFQQVISKKKNPIKDPNNN
jgi:hypothetical protein